MSDRTMPVTGPHRIYVDAIPAGATLDISAYLETVILALVRDENGAMEDIVAADESASFQLSHGNDDSHAGHERDQLVQELVERLSPRLPVYGGQVGQLAAALSVIARPKGLPVQRKDGAAA